MILLLFIVQCDAFKYVLKLLIVRIICICYMYVIVLVYKCCLSDLMYFLEEYSNYNYFRKLFLNYGCGAKTHIFKIMPEILFIWFGILIFHKSCNFQLFCKL